jgi:hypothetical protein
MHQLAGTTAGGGAAPVRRFSFVSVENLAR